MARRWLWRRAVLDHSGCGAGTEGCTGRRARWRGFLLSDDCGEVGRGGVWCEAISESEGNGAVVLVLLVDDGLMVVRWCGSGAQRSAAHKWGVAMCTLGLCAIACHSARHAASLSS